MLKTFIASVDILLLGKEKTVFGNLSIFEARNIKKEISKENKYSCKDGVGEKKQLTIANLSKDNHVAGCSVSTMVGMQLQYNEFVSNIEYGVAISNDNAIRKHGRDVTIEVTCEQRETTKMSCRHERKRKGHLFIILFACFFVCLVRGCGRCFGSDLVVHAKLGDVIIIVEMGKI